MELLTILAQLIKSRVSLTAKMSMTRLNPFKLHFQIDEAPAIESVEASSRKSAIKRSLTRFIYKFREFFAANFQRKKLTSLNTRISTDQI